MDIFSRLFSSKAKIAILRVLSLLSDPLALRQIEKLTKLPVYSVQYALKQLLKAKLVIKTRNKKKIFYQLNANSSDYDFLISLFQAENRKGIQLRSIQFIQKAKSVLQFNEEAHQLFRRPLKCISQIF